MSRLFCTFVSRRSASQLIYSEYGPPSEVVKIKHFEDPTEVGDTGVIVRMLASPIHPADINTIQGTYPLKPPLPAVGGGEGVGEVIQVGDHVKNLKIGDWVFPGGNMKGTWTTHFVESESNLVKVRNDISVLSASTLRTNPGTAYRMLKDFVPLNSDDDYIIQNGANSAVGRAVIEIAKAMDIKTINIIRDREDVDALKTELQEMGADIVWTEQELRQTELFKKKHLPKPKLALNCVGGQSGKEILQCLAHKGVHVTYGGMSLKPVTVPTSALIFKDISVRGFWMTKWIEDNFDNPERIQMYEELGDMAAKGILNPPKNIFVPLTEYSDALTNCMKGFKAGKYIFDMR